MIKKIFGFYRLPLYILVHPVDGFYAMKFENQGTLKVAIFNLFLLGIAYAISAQYTSIIVFNRHPLNLHSLMEFFVICVALVLFCVSNWSVTCLTDGEGRFKDVIMALCYSFTPLIFTIIPATIISNFLSAEETGFHAMILTVGTGYFVFLVFLGLLTVHNYTVVKALITIGLTFVAILVIVFLVTLMFTLLMQLWGFLDSVYTELIFR